MNWVAIGIIWWRSQWRDKFNHQNLKQNFFLKITSTMWILACLDVLSIYRKSLDGLKFDTATQFQFLNHNLQSDKNTFCEFSWTELQNLKFLKCVEWFFQYKFLSWVKKCIWMLIVFFIINNKVQKRISFVTFPIFCLNKIHFIPFSWCL